MREVTILRKLKPNASKKSSKLETTACASICLQFGCTFFYIFFRGCLSLNLCNLPPPPQSLVPHPFPPMAKATQKKCMFPTYMNQNPPISTFFFDFEKIIDTKLVNCGRIFGKICPQSQNFLHFTCFFLPLGKKCKKKK